MSHEDFLATFGLFRVAGNRPGDLKNWTHGKDRSLNMARILLFVLFLSFGALTACNPSDPTGPKDFSLFEIYGLWKMRLDDTGCGPAEIINVEIGPFGLAATADSVRVSGSWYLDQKNPESFPVRGHIFRVSGLAILSMNDLDTEFIRGVFVSNKKFAGGFRILGECEVRLTGKFIE